MKRFISLIFCLFVLAGLTFAQISLKKHKNFVGITETLEELAEREGKFRQNIFYISDVKKDGSREFAYAYWKQDNSIIILHLPLEKDTADYYWLYSKARIDLLIGVVPTKKDIGGSTFLVDKLWADKITKRCLKGYKFSVSATNN